MVMRNEHYFPLFGDVLDTIRRRAGLRGTFSAYRNPLTASSIQSREKSPQNNRTSATRMNTIAIAPPSPAKKIDKDIIKHASRLRRMSQSKDLLSRYSTTDTSPPRTTSTRRSNSTSKSSKSLSLVSRNNRLKALVSLLSFFNDCNEYSWRG